MSKLISRRTVMGAVAAFGLIAAGQSASAADPIKLRISTPAVDLDWHAKMLPIFKQNSRRQRPANSTYRSISTARFSNKAQSLPPCSVATSKWP